MIKSAHLQNYRQYEDRKFDFGSGLIVIRGVSEAGKSTIIESVAYAMFGTKMLRDGLADAVHYDEAGVTAKQTALKVTVELVVNGVLYTISRGKSGAEITYREESVTGQKECTQFMENLLQIPKGRVTELLLAGQNDVQGILKQGSAALSVTIENLAGFEQVDALIDKIKEKYPTGAAKHLEEQIKELRGRLDNLPELEDYSGSLGTLAETVASAEEGLKTNEDQQTDLSETVTEIKQRIGELEKAKLRADAIQSSQDKAKELEGNISTISTEIKDIGDELDSDRITGAANTSSSELTEQIEKIDQEMSRYNTFLAYKELPHSDLPREAQNKEEFLADYQELTKDIRETNTIVQSIDTDIQIAKSKLNLDESCVTCGQDISHLDSIVQLNAAQEATIRERTAEKGKQTALLAEADVELNRMRDLIDAATVLDKALVLLEASPHISVDRSVFPANVDWTGDTFSGDMETQYAELSEDLVKLSTDLETLESINNEAHGLRSRLSGAEERLSSSNSALLTVKASLADAADIDLPGIDKDLSAETVLLNEKESERTLLANSVRDLTAKRDQANEEIRKINELVRDDQVRREELAKQISTVEAQHKEQSFGAALVKTVRDARIQVANRLWGVVLATVSSYFTSMRQIPTVVTKTEKGFRVNDKALESLSGSTLDICGVALRLAVIQIFMPATNFAIFDEISGGCDDERTSAVTGFLLGSGFEQTFLLTHKEVDEGAADQLIVVEPGG